MYLGGAISLFKEGMRCDPQLSKIFLKNVTIEGAHCHCGRYSCMDRVGPRICRSHSQMYSSVIPKPPNLFTAKCAYPTDLIT